MKNMQKGESVVSMISRKLRGYVLFFFCKVLKIPLLISLSQTQNESNDVFPCFFFGQNKEH